jgi:DNA-binding MarR family transcriptional regulator
MPPDRSLGYLIRYAHRALVAMLARELAQYRVSTAEWTVLRALWPADGCSQVELAQRIRVEKASLTAVLASLHRKGLLLRHRDRADRRRITVTLTPAGRALKPRILPIAARINRKATRGLSKSDVAQLRRVLLDLTANLESGEAGRCKSSVRERRSARTRPDTQRRP